MSLFTTGGKVNCSVNILHQVDPKLLLSLIRLFFVPFSVIKMILLFFLCVPVLVDRHP